jgi:phosphatidylserine/phosphatidylglycerophosphate/cardiolipin synthase-like enzyme
MTDYHCILDNSGLKVADYLRDHLRSAETLRLVSAYFSIYGYELLGDELAGVGEVRFLFGDPASVDDPDPGRNTPKSFALTETGLVPKHALRQKFLARRCAQWVSRGGVHIRSVSRSNFLHGKMYLADGADQGASVVGSSNFTRNGLGGGVRRTWRSTWRRSEGTPGVICEIGSMSCGTTRAWLST